MFVAVVWWEAAFIAVVSLLAAVGLFVVVWIVVHVRGWLHDIRYEERQAALDRGLGGYVHRGGAPSASGVDPADADDIAPRDWMADIDHYTRGR